MTRRIISMLLAALVMFCPIKCLIAGCHSCGSSCGSQPLEPESHSCGCCFDDPCDRPDTPENDKSKPEQPDDCTCNNCFCAGALTVSDAPIDFPELESARLFEMICWSVVDERIPLFPQTPPTAFFLHRLASGAELRAALSCWIL